MLYSILITDAPLGPGARIKAFNHLLGESGMTFFAPRALAAKIRKGFPGSLDAARRHWASYSGPKAG